MFAVIGFGIVLLACVGVFGACGVVVGFFVVTKSLRKMSLIIPLLMLASAGAFVITVMNAPFEITAHLK